MNYIAILEDLGLSRRESKTYLALLELGPTTTGEITKKTDIPSSKIYEVLDRLMKKGLASYVVRKNQKHFQACDPEEVLSYSEQRQQQFQQILPELKEKQKQAKDTQNVELYEGKPAVFRMVHNLIEKAKHGDEYLGFSVGYEHDDPDVVRFYTNLTWKRKEKGLKIKVLTNQAIKRIYEKRYSKKVLQTINNRFTKFQFPQGLIILNNTVVILNLQGKVTGIKITGINLADQYRKFFHQIYKTAKPT